LNYYPFHVGDYAAHTSHLEPLEDLAYRRLLDLYYLRESPIPSDVHEAARLVRMREHVQCVESVLREFFTPSPEGWKNARCDAELARMRDKQAKARASAEASIKARRANAQRTLSERSANVELPTPIPIPTPNIEDIRTQSVRNNTRARARKPTVAIDCPDDVDRQVFEDWLAVRKAKRAGPVTQTVLSGIRAEAMKAGISLQDAIAHCCLAGWQGFRADWYLNQPEKRAIITKRRSIHDERADTIAILTGRRRKPEQDADVIDVTPTAPGGVD
jgi:uncharacterized protein YdaU (DUF1376 family)